MNWVELIEANGIHHVTSGSNTVRGEISIKCPFCGDEDPSQHMGINLTSGYWGCWRDPTHRGKAPYRLVQALLGCSYDAARLVVAQFNHSAPDTLLSLTPTSGHLKPMARQIEMPEEFRRIEGYGTTHKFWKYLWNRGFDKPNALIEQYGLRCCMVGRWKDRVIIPVYERTKLIGWQGRALTSRTYHQPRYLTSSSAVKQTLFNLQNLSGGKTLYVCEGPFDAMKIDFYGQPEVRATCGFGLSVSPEQLSLLNDLKDLFEKVVILLDATATSQAFELSNWVKGSTVGLLPENSKDPGEMSPTQIRSLIS